MWIKNWFSNMLEFDQPLVVDGISYPAVENYYQAMKLPDDDIENKKYIASLHPRKSKIEIRNMRTKEWNNATKLAVMQFALRHKFKENTSWGKKLLETGDQEIVEWNNWNDTFFGKDIKTGKGANHLGIMLMQIRNEIKMEKALNGMIL
jgi:ribA/ribD-fused uncharacterized protein